MKIRHSTTFIFILLSGYNLFSQATLPFEDNFNSGSLNSSWWVPFPNMNGVDGVVEIESGIGTNNSKGLKIGKLNDNTGFTTNALDLYLNLSNQTNVEMTFWIADWYDETDMDDGIYFSDNGGDSFSKVVDFHPDEWCDYLYGQYPPLDIDKLAASAGLTLTNQFVIRFQQRGEDDFYGSSPTGGDGFFLDDVKVYDPGLVYSTLPFEDDFDTGLFKDSWAWNFADLTASISSNFDITSPMSKVAIESGIGTDGSYGVEIGRRCDGAFTTNALDLHLNLSNQTNVEMTFWIADWYDETDMDDGIYFSDNGGATFTKVFDFDFSNADNYSYKKYQLSISNLALTNSIGLTEQFVVRFQQRGEDDFSGSSPTGGDGFFLDDVKVAEMPLATPPPDINTLVRLFPNPTYNILHLDLKKASLPNGTLKVYDSSGKVLLNTLITDTTMTLDIESIPAGILWVQIISNDLSLIKKIIKL